MSRLIQRIVSPARMPAGTGPNFILSMTTLWTLGAGPAVGDAGAPRVGGDGRRVRPAPAARMVSLDLVSRAYPPDARHGPGVRGTGCGRSADAPSARSYHPWGLACPRATRFRTRDGRPHFSPSL